jgi:hypothetical protein
MILQLGEFDVLFCHIKTNGYYDTNGTPFYKSYQTLAVCMPLWAGITTLCTAVPPVSWQYATL